MFLLVLPVGIMKFMLCFFVRPEGHGHHPPLPAQEEPPPAGAVNHPKGVRPRQHHVAEWPAQHVLELPQQLAAHQPLSNWLKAQQHTLTWHLANGAPAVWWIAWRDACHWASCTHTSGLPIGSACIERFSCRREGLLFYGQKICRSKRLMLLYLLLRVEFWGSTGEDASVFSCFDGR
jgi:hypothetical protein